MSILTPSLEQRLEFAPPTAPGSLPAGVLAVLVHLLLVVALAFSVQWKHQTDTPAIEAELWSAVPAQAAPKAIEPPIPAPVLPALPAPTPEPPTPLTPVPPRKVVVTPPPMPDVQDAQIALAREKRKAQEKAKAESERLAQKRAEEKAAELADQQRKEDLKKQRTLDKKAEAQAQAKADAKDKAVQDKRDKQDADKKQAAKDKAKQVEAEQRQAADRNAKAVKAEKADQAKAAASKAEADARYDNNMKRIMGQANATGDANATGTALRASGPSANYGGKIAARIKPNIVFPDDIPGNPAAEVEVRTAPDGSIVGTPRLVKSSGFKAWDDAVIKAILKTETLPKDVDGRIPPVISMVFRPKDLGLQ